MQRTTPITHTHAKPITKEIYYLSEGDVFEWSRLGKVSFTRYKRGGRSMIVLQISTGKSWSTRIGSSDTVLVTGTYIMPKKASDNDNLKEGDLFVINNGKRLELYKFSHFTSAGKIICTQPLSKGKWTLDPSFECFLVSNL